MCEYVSHHICILFCGEVLWHGVIVYLPVDGIN